MLCLRITVYLIEYMYTERTILLRNLNFTEYRSENNFENLKVMSNAKNFDILAISLNVFYIIILIVQ